MIDYQSLLYGPAHYIIGVDAVLVFEATDAEPITLTVIDKTSGIDTSREVDVQTIEPACVARMSEMAGVDLDDLRGSAITFNGKTWHIGSHRLRPSPKGEADGEIYLILSEA